MANAKRVLPGSTKATVAPSERNRLKLAAVRPALAKRDERRLPLKRP